MNCMLQFVVGCFGLGSVFVTDGSVRGGGGPCRPVFFSAVGVGWGFSPVWVGVGLFFV